MSAPEPAFDLTGWKSRIAAVRGTDDPAGESGSLLVRTVDELLAELARRAGWTGSGRALVAQGGYGRRELAPHSDLDLIFLVRRGAGATGVDAVLYPLWDLGFEVGHALRTPADCAEVAAADLTAATALLDARVLVGDAALLAAAQRRAGIRPEGSREMRRWIARILEDVEVRRERFGEVSHLLEPHVKEGRGGLRDLQACRWVLQCQGRDPKTVLPELAAGSELLAAEGVLNRVRAALHRAAGRKTDHLTFEFHREVAAQVLPEAPLEAFFEALHRAGHRIVGAWEEVSTRAQQALLPPRKRSVLREPLRSPDLLIREVLSWCRTGGTLPELLRHSLTRGDPALRAAVIRSAAAKILRSRVPLAGLLHELHHLGLLGLLAPELEAVAHQVHYDARHAFTTGVHCVETLRAFEELWLGAYETTEPHLTRVAGAVLNPAVVRLAALCHDLGKADGVTDHARAGVPIALALARRLGLDDDEAAEVAHLVAQHQRVPTVAFSGDLEDPASWEAVRDAAGSPAAVDALVALAFADLVATNPSTWSGVWSDWKRDLLITLHARAQGSEEPDLARAGRLRHAVEVAGREADLGDLGELWNRIPPREVRQVPPDLLAQLLALTERLGDEPARWLVETRREGLADVLGVVQPIPRVLSATTGALARLGLTILSFQVHTWTDGTAHLWLRVAHPSEIPPAEEVDQALTAAVTGAARDPSESGRTLFNPRDEAVPVQTRVRLLPGDNPFFSVLEVRCRDRRGLVRDLSRLFEGLGLSVEYALVTTHGPTAQDVFHLKDIFGGRVEGADKVEALLAGARAVAEEAGGPGG